MFELTRSNIDLGLVCSNFDASLHFYRNILGLEVVAEVHIPSETAIKAGLAPRKFRQIRLQAGDTLIKLMEIEAPPKSRTEEFAAGVRWLTFFVSDIQSTYNDLTVRGAHFISEPIPGDDRVIGENTVAGVVCAVDPDGILIEFVEL